MSEARLLSRLISHHFFRERTKLLSCTCISVGGRDGIELKAAVQCVPNKIERERWPGDTAQGTLHRGRRRGKVKIKSNRPHELCSDEYVRSEAHTMSCTVTQSPAL